MPCLVDFVTAIPSRLTDLELGVEGSIALYRDRSSPLAPIITLRDFVSDYSDVSAATMYGIRAAPLDDLPT
jgi:hypothetical protein